MNKNNVVIKDNKVIKKRNDRVLELYDYLSSRGFDNYPNVLNKNDETIESEYIKESNIYEECEGEELIKTISALHSKTVEYKSTSKNKYRQIYDSISGNIEYLKEYYENMISDIEEEEYMKSSHYLIARNYTIIDSSIKYSSRALKTWFNKVSDKSKERVCIVHNNISSSHFIKGDKNCLLSFDNYLVDTPILDLYKYYKREGYKLDFNRLLDIYENNFKLLDEEKLLLNVLVSIPPKIIEVNNEYLNCKNIRSLINYINISINVVNNNK